ncbi:hypothetical protein Sjap_015499 [Stephania japonica]|uniref:Uncharacterized protein n=1 Tax=Stephania japonica TaxID=461633 RepID=A0AAP0IL59_9MAGN
MFQLTASPTYVLGTASWGRHRGDAVNVPMHDVTHIRCTGSGNVPFAYIGNKRCVACSRSSVPPNHCLADPGPVHYSSDPGPTTVVPVFGPCLSLAGLVPEFVSVAAELP